MEDNELEVVDKTTEDNQDEETTNVDETEVEETIEEDELEDDSDTPSLEDYKELQKKTKTLQAQKEHWRKKAETFKTNVNNQSTEVSNDKLSNKNNTEQINQSEIIELSRLAARGYSDEDIELLRDIKSLKGLNSLAEATDTPLFKANKEQREKEERSRKSQLKPSISGRMFSDGKEVTKDDLKKAWLGK